MLNDWVLIIEITERIIIEIMIRKDRVVIIPPDLFDADEAGEGGEADLAPAALADGDGADGVVGVEAGEVFEGVAEEGVDVGGGPEGPGVLQPLLDAGAEARPADGGDVHGGGGDG